MKMVKEMSPIFSYIQTSSVSTFLLSVTFPYVTLNFVLRVLMCFIWYTCTPTAFPHLYFTPTINKQKRNLKEQLFKAEKNTAGYMAKIFVQ